MRTDEEIIEKLKYLEDGRDFFGVQSVDLLVRLSFEAASRWLKPDAKDKWTQDPRDRETVLAEMKDYMPFAWEKATGHRGLSANRSIDHYRAWVWLIGDEEMLAFIEDDANYPQYGAPILARICKTYGFEIPSEAMRMAEGKFCSPDCEEGCGR